MKLFGKVAVIYNRILDSTVALAGALSVAMVLFMSLEVFMRYVLNRPQEWVQEAVEATVAFVAFLSAAWILKIRRHVSLDIVVSRFNPRTRALINLILMIISAIMFSLLVVYGTQVVVDRFQRNIRMSTMLAPPSGPFFAVMTIGLFLLVIQCLISGYGYLKEWKALSGKNK